MAHARNHRIQNKAEALYRQRNRKFNEVDMGGGSGRIGTRITPIDLLSKAQRLRPSRDAA